MSQSEEIAKQPTNQMNEDDLSDLHSMQIRSIQPHGVLFVLDDRLEIVQVSNNTETYLDRKPQDLLGKPLKILFNRQFVEQIKRSFAQAQNTTSFLKLSLSIATGKRYFDGIIHSRDNIVILELEPTESRTEMSFLSFHTLLKATSTKIQKTSNLSEFLHVVASEVRSIVAFDRVMVYQFDSTGAGCVIAEAKREDLSSYLGLHYPATDIPEHSRELYKLYQTRHIPDISTQLTELIPADNPLTNLPLDLSYCVLRGFSPCCQTFHENMGIAALLTIALLQDGKLWGLISCHHQTPKYLAYEVRTVCEFLGQIISRELANQISHEEFDYQVKLQSLQAEFLESISQAQDFSQALIEPAIRLLDLVSATGAAVCLGDTINLVGLTPTIAEVRCTIEWAETQISDILFSTNSLPKLYPAAKAFKDTASGLLLLRISKLKRYYILWFRPEVIQTVNWAGNPNESIQVEADGSLTLCPRNSFESWQEIVRFTSISWQQCELDSAIALKNAIVGIVLSKADELAKINLELERSNRELASFAYAASHDLKEPLRGIYNYSTILLEDYASLLDEEGIDYLQTLVSLSKRMDTLIDVLLKFSQIGQSKLNLQPSDLNELIDEAIDIFHASRQDEQIDFRIPRSLPTIQCDPVLINEVFSNLIANAIKYNESTQKRVEIGYLDRLEQLRQELNSTFDQNSIVFYVRDNGIGIQTHYLETIFRLFKRLHSQDKYGGGAGAGLAIAKKIIELHNGQIWVKSNHGEGSTFYFSLN